MKRNLSDTDRVLRVIVAALFAYFYFSGTFTGALGLILLALGAVSLVTSIFAYCPLYAALNFSTFKR